MENKKEKTALTPSVAADGRQPIHKNAEISISKYEENIKSFEEMQREMQLSLDPSYLKAVSMNELFDTQYQSKPPLIDGLLYPGTYIFAGSPKLGKSFLMAQLAYHISTGTPLWNLPPEKERYCISPLRMITAVYRSVCIGCLGQRVQTTFSSLFLPASLGKGCMNSLQGL